jgi:hypothetical protein
MKTRDNKGHKTKNKNNSAVSGCESQRRRPLCVHAAIILEKPSCENDEWAVRRAGLADDGARGALGERGAAQRSSRLAESVCLLTLSRVCFRCLLSHGMSSCEHEQCTRAQQQGQGILTRSNRALHEAQTQTARTGKREGGGGGEDADRKHVSCLLIGGYGCPPVDSTAQPVVSGLAPPSQCAVSRNTRVPAATGGHATLWRLTKRSLT